MFHCIPLVAATPYTGRSIMGKLVLISSARLHPETVEKAVKPLSSAARKHLFLQKRKHILLAQNFARQSRACGACHGALLQVHIAVFVWLASGHACL